METKHGAVVAIVVAAVGAGGLGVVMFKKMTDLGDLYKFGQGEVCGVEQYKSGYGSVCGTDPNSFVPIKDLGYSGGNKNNHCIGQGFAGHDSGKPNGRCFKYATCRDAQFGVDTFKKCQHQQFGQEGFWTKLRVALFGSEQPS